MKALNIIYTMWLREMKRFVRAKSRIIGNLAMPFFFLVILGSGFGPFFSSVGGGSYLELIAPGIIAMILLFSSMFAGISVLWDRQFGFMKEVLVAPVSRLSIMLGKTMGAVTTSMIQALIILSAIVAVGLVSADVLGVMLAFALMFLISASFVSLGLAFASRMSDAHGFQLVMNFLIMPTFFLSGALFPLEGLPGWLKTATLFNPLTYGVDGLRTVLGGVGHMPLVLDFFILVVFWLAMTALGAHLFRKASI